MAQCPTRLLPSGNIVIYIVKTSDPTLRSLSSVCPAEKRRTEEHQNPRLDSLIVFESI